MRFFFWRWIIPTIRVENVSSTKRNSLSPMNMCCPWPVNIRKSFPACSIHPARKDAIEELERCAEKGGKSIKTSTNRHHVDCSNIQYQPFWEKLAKLGLPFLCPPGGEFSVPVLNAKFADPRILRLTLVMWSESDLYGLVNQSIWGPDPHAA